MKPGMCFETKQTITNAHSAKALGSGTMDVLSTPYLIALMENAAMNAVASALEPGFETVGVRIDVAHITATPVGGTVTARAILTAADGRRLTFSLEAFDEKQKIGEGSHERFIVNREKFLGKLQAGN